MSEPTEKEMLEVMDGQIMGWEIIVKTDSRTLKSGKRPDEFLSILYAIRRLIEKFFELKERADAIWELSPTIEEFVDGVPLKELVREIRDFGKEKK